MKISPISRFVVNGNSMLPSLFQGQDVLSFNWAYLGKKPQVGDIVVVKYENREIIKRVQNTNGREVFVQGDNLIESTDSRHFGPIKLNQIVGKVVYIGENIPCPSCGGPVIGVYGRKDAICKNCGFKLSCCGEP